MQRRLRVRWVITNSAKPYILTTDCGPQRGIRDDPAQVRGLGSPRTGLCSLLLLLAVAVCVNLGLTLWLIASLHIDLVGRMEQEKL